MKITRNFSIDRDIFDALKIISMEQKISMSQIVENCLTQCLPELNSIPKQQTKLTDFEQWKIDTGRI